MLELTEMKDTAGLYSIGDFAGFCEYVGSARPQHHSEKRWRLMQISDGLSGRDLDLMNRMQIEMYRPLLRRMAFVPTNKLSKAQRNQPIRPLREKIEPFFPGYAFLTFSDSDDRWREVFKMVGVRGLVCANHNPVEVSWKMIEEIQAREIDGAVPSTTKLIELPYILGERIRITKGAFASFPGAIGALPAVDEAQLGNMTIEELDESFKVKLLVDLFGRTNEINLPLSDIEKF